MEIKVNEMQLREIAKKFDEKTKEIALQVVTEKTAELQNKAKEFAMIRTKAHTGKLIAGITSKVSKKKNELIIGTVSTTAKNKVPKRPGSRNIKLSEKTYKNGALYGTYLEGSKRYRNKSTNESKYAHLKPAYDIVKPTVKTELIERLKDACKEELKK